MGAHETEEVLHRLTDETSERWETAALLACKFKGHLCPGGTEFARVLMLVIVAACGLNTHNGRQRFMHLGDDAQIDLDSNVKSRFYYNGEDCGVRVVCKEADLNRGLAWIMKECQADDALYNVIRSKIAAWFSRDERTIAEHADIMRETALR